MTPFANGTSHVVGASMMSLTKRSSASGIAAADGLSPAGSGSVPKHIAGNPLAAAGQQDHMKAANLEGTAENQVLLVEMSGHI
jgi:hypothetical protein